MTEKMKSNPRRLALRLLGEWEKNDKYSNLLLESPALSSLSGEERAFLTALVYGVIERSLTLDYRIECLTGRPAARLAGGTRRLLRLGLYQLTEMKGVPAHAAVNETVALASHRGERSLVNAVLREAGRHPEKMAPPAREDGLAAHLSVVYSAPLALVELFLSQYGEEMTEAILAAALTPAPLTLRVNTEKTDRATLLTRLRESGIEAKETPYSPVGIRLQKSENPRILPGFAEGCFYIQDEASQLATLALSPTPGSLCIDTCACPGGKSFGLALLMQNRGRVLSLDLHESKLPLIRDGAARLGLSCIETRAHDGREAFPALVGQADYVLCDAPCSGLGVLGKKADLRYRARLRLSEMPPLQLSILEAASAYVRAGGTIVYSTCTLNEAENGGVCREFLEKHPEFIPEHFSVATLSSQDGALTLLPPVHGTDGFFIAKFKRRKEEK